MKREHQLREEICRIGESLYRRNYTVGSAGNISVRLPADAGGGWLITPTDACLGFLDPAAIARVDADGRQVGGERASKTLVLHRAIYQAAPDAHAVVHTHSTSLVALTLAGVWREDDVLPPITPYYVMKVGHVPLIPYRRPGDPEVAQMVCRHVGRSRAVLLERLGPVVWHASVSQAAWALEELEETARLWMSLPDKPAPLAEARIAELNKVFKTDW
jgi:ribulose-5-phosphate 4-epimerase/fuculose-1-phosphate aldolase